MYIYYQQQIIEFFDCQTIRTPSHFQQYQDIFYDYPFIYNKNFSQSFKLLPNNNINVKRANSLPLLSTNNIEWDC